MNEFRRSGRFGLVGVVVVAVLVAVIALVFGSGANPTGALIAIFVIVFGFVGVLMYLQRRDLDSAIAGGSTVAVGGSVAPFQVLARDEHLRAAKGVPPAVEAAVAPLRASGYWKDVSFEGGPGGVVAERKRDGAENWMRDLWVAERLSDAAVRA